MPCAAALDPQVRRELPMVKLVKPLEMLVRGEVKSFGRVDVPGLGLRFLTNDIIMGCNNNTQNAAGHFFRELSDDKKKEVSNEPHLYASLEHSIVKFIVYKAPYDSNPIEQIHHSFPM